MIKLLIEKLPRILQNRKRLEEDLKVKIKNRGKEVYIEGGVEKEFIAEKVLEALNFGFPYSAAILLSEEGEVFEIINIKEQTKRKDIVRIKARIIGTKGKTIKTISGLTKCNFEIKDNDVGIIGDQEYIGNAREAILSLIKGSKQGNVYAYLEKHQIKFEPDLGLRK